MTGEGEGAIEYSRRELAIVVTRGSSNNLFQVATLVRAATALEMRVLVFFKEGAAGKLRRERVNVPDWAPTYARVEPQLIERLGAADFEDMERFLRDAKQHGNDVEFWVEAESLDREGIGLVDLVPLLDGALDEAAFRQRATVAMATLTF